VLRDRLQRFYQQAIQFIDFIDSTSRANSWLDLASLVLSTSICLLVHGAKVKSALVSAMVMYAKTGRVARIALFIILDGMAKATDNTGRHATKTGHTRGNTAYYEQLSGSV
jgi:hypothetical protein